MMQKLKIARLRRMIYRWRRKRPARLVSCKLFLRKMPVIRFPRMTMRINNIGCGSDNKQGNDQKADIGQVFLLFKESW